MSSVRIQLANDTATLECRFCGGSASMSTADRNALVVAVRNFLLSHDDCADGNDTPGYGRTKALMVAQR